MPKLLATNAPALVIIIRLMVGLYFFRKGFRNCFSLRTSVPGDLSESVFLSQK